MGSCNIIFIEISVDKGHVLQTLQWQFQIHYKLYLGNIAGRVSETAELRRRDGGWGGGERRYKEGGRRIQEDITSTFAVAIATPISHLALCISHLAFRTSHFALYVPSYYHSHRASCI